MVLIDEDTEVAPGVWLRLAPGHNRDMTIATATSGGHTFGFFSDLVPSMAHLPLTWIPAFDLFPLESIANRRKWLGHAAAENWIAGLGHDCDVAFTRIVERGGKFLPAPVAASLTRYPHSKPAIP